MKYLVAGFFFTLLSLMSFSQKKNHMKDAIGISIPLIQNNSNGIFYSLGNKREPEGKAISYGISLNYSRQVYKGIFATAGVGYFKQSFNIIRPFEFDGDTVTNLLYATKKYSYHCIALNAGLGYRYAFNSRWAVNGLASFYLLRSFKQSYTPTRYSGYNHKTTQTNTRSLQVGNMVSLSAGADYRLTSRISVGLNILFPIVVRWKKDEIFTYSYFGDDAQTIAQTKFSIGTMVSCKYHF